MPKRLMLQRVASQFLAAEVPQLGGAQSNLTTSYNGWQALEDDLRVMGVSEQEIARIKTDFDSGKSATAVDFPTPQEARINLALAELNRRRVGVTQDWCPRCGVFDWNVDIIDIPASSAMALPQLPAGGAYRYTPQPTGFISMLSLVCKNCGYTMLHNMGVLGA